MELIFIHINKEFGALKNKSFNLSSKFNISYDLIEKRLIIEDNPNHLRNFFGNQIENVTCVIGENGVGKTTFLRYIKELYFERRNEIDIRDGDIVAYADKGFIYVHASKSLGFLNIENRANGFSSKLIHYKRKPKVFDHLKGDLTIYYSNNFDLYDDFIESEILYNTSTTYLSRTYNARIYKKKKKKKVNLDYRFLINEFQRNRNFLNSDKSNSIKSLLKRIDYVEIHLEEIKDSDYKRLIDKLIKRFTSTSEKEEEIRREWGIYNQNEKDYVFKIRNLRNAFNKLKSQNLFDGGRPLFDLKLAEIIVFELINKFIMSNGFWENINLLITEVDDLIIEQNIKGSLYEFLRKYPGFFKSNLENKKENIRSYTNKIERLLEFLFYEDQLWFNYENSPALDVDNNLLDKLISDIFELPFTKNYIKLEWPRLSAGEESMITFFARIDAAIRIKSKNRNSILILIDEGDLYFHPEWQRQYLKAIFDFLNQYKELNFQIILTSHSPFILSDLPSDNVITFKRTESGIDVSKQEITKTFGGNIHELLIDKFFLKDTIIGAFADSELIKLIDRINKRKLKDQDSILIDEIGDKFLKATIKTSLEEENDQN